MHFACLRNWLKKRRKFLHLIPLSLQHKAGEFRSISVSVGKKDITQFGINIVQ